MARDCEHKRRKKNFPFGRKSKPDEVCKDCGEVITKKMLEIKRKEKVKNAKLKRAY